MSDKMRYTVARDLLDVLAMRGTPDIIALDCALKRKYSAARPWPFEDADDAASFFSEVIAGSQKKYVGISVRADKNILYLTKKDG